MRKLRKIVILGAAIAALGGCSSARTTEMAVKLGEMLVGGVDTVYVRVEMVNPCDSLKK